MRRGFLNKPPRVRRSVKCLDPNCFHGDDVVPTCQPCEPTRPASAADISPSSLLTSDESQMLHLLKALKRDILSDKFVASNPENMLLQDGVFSQLIESRKSFSDLLFPGTPSSALEVLPKCLKDLLEWDKLKVDDVKIAKSAASVMEGVKRRGALVGDFLDNESALLLTVPVIREAFARELVVAVKDVAKILESIKSIDAPLAINPPAPFEELDFTLDEVTISSLMDAGVAKQVDFLGKEWTELFCKDSRRFVSNERMSAMQSWRPSAVANTVTDSPAVVPTVSWIDADAEDLEENYPALAEAVKQLHMLPYKINYETECALRLQAPRGCRALLAHFPKQSLQPARLDNAVIASYVDPNLTANQTVAVDSGIRLTATYTFFECKDEGADDIHAARFWFTDSIVVTGAQRIGTGTGPVWTKEGIEGNPKSLGFPSFAGREVAASSLPLCNDYLTLHKSLEIVNARGPASRDYFTIYYFMYGNTS